MGYEKKYNNALKGVRELYKVMRIKSSTDALNTITALKEIFPELAESEDEKIWKEIIQFIKKRDRSGCDYDYDKWIDWLEKQHTDPYNGVCFDCYGHHWGMCARDNGIEIAMDGNLVRYFSYKDCEQTFGDKSALEAINEEKVDNQNCVKPAHKVEPRFKVGEWITHNTANFVFKIISVGSDGYGVVNRENHKKTISFDNEDNYHLWSIEDAKDGGVLHSPSRRLIWIYKDNEHYHACIDMNYVTENIDIDGFKIPSDVCPATSVQRSILFSKMEGAGYEWNAEKLELKKDSCYCEGKAEIDYCFTKMMNGEKVSSAWSEEDERNMQNIDSVVFYDNSLPEDTCVRLRNWLKSLKQRIGE